MTELSDAQLLRITCAKGGTSVLADACLAHGWLSDTESRFSFEWGVLLQLGDDLQDVREDLARGSHSLFTRAVRAKIPLDALVIQLLNFSERVTAEMDCLPGASKMLKELLSTSWRSLIVSAVRSRTNTSLLNSWALSSACRRFDLTSCERGTRNYRAGKVFIRISLKLCLNWANRTDRCRSMLEAQSAWEPISSPRQLLPLRGNASFRSNVPENCQIDSCTGFSRASRNRLIP